MYVRKVISKFGNSIFLLGLLILCIVIFLSISVYANYISLPILDDLSCYNIEKCFEKYGVEYFAYMKLENADASLKSLILEARKRIINKESWVADDVVGRIVDRCGNVVEILPHFSDIFPSDWEPPTYPILSVDKEYYGLSN